MRTTMKKLILASLLLSTVLLAAGSAYAAPLYFPHVDTSLPWQTEIAIINTRDQSVTGTLRGLSDEGQLVDTKNVTLSARGRRQITVANEFTNHTDIGYIIFDTNSAAVQGYTKFYQAGIYRAAIPAVKEVNTSDIYISHIDSSALWWTGVSLVNTTSARKDLTITFNNGQSVPYPLNANEHKVFTIGDLLNQSLQPDIKSAVITNASGVIGLELFGSIGSSNQMDGILLTDKTASTIYYPHVDSNGWWTGIVAYNPSQLPCTITITPYDAQGTPLTPSTPPPIAGNGKYVGVVAQLGLPAQTAWIKIDSTRPITGFELFGTVDNNQLAAYAGGGGTGAKSGVFAKIEKNGGWTGIAFVNTEAGLASVTLTAYNDTGTAVATQALPVGGHAKVVNLAEAIFSQDISGATYIAYSSDRNVVGFQLNGTSDGMMLDGLPGLGGTSYQFSMAWGSIGAGDGQFNFNVNKEVEAAGVAVDGSGNVYVADWANHRIQKFDSNGNFLAKWGNMGSGDGQFYAPIGIAIAPNGDVLVAESGNSRVQRFTAAGAFVAKWGSRGTGDGQFMNPNGIAVSPAGTIYVADTFNHRIQKFDSNGNFLAKWGSQGTGDGQFRYVYGVAVSPTGKVYAGDTGNSRIQVFDGSGVFQGKFGAPGTIDGKLIYPNWLAFDADGNLFVVDFENDWIVEYDPANAFLRKWGSHGSGDGQFDVPYAVAVDSNASVFVADTNNNRIQKFVRVP